MNKLKYCKFCDKEKPIKDFVKSGFATKNICRECQNKKQTQMYRNSKKVKELQQENKQLKEEYNKIQKAYESTFSDYQQLKDNWNKLKEWVNKHYDYYINNEDYIGGRLCFTDMKDKMQELKGSDSNVKD